MKNCKIGVFSQYKSCVCFSYFSDFSDFSQKDLDVWAKPANTKKTIKVNNVKNFSKKINREKRALNFLYSVEKLI